MNLNAWVTFACMAVVWGAFCHVAEHYAALTLNTYRAKQVEDYYTRHLRGFLQ